MYSVGFNSRLSRRGAPRWRKFFEIWNKLDVCTVIKSQFKPLVGNGFCFSEINFGLVKLNCVVKSDNFPYILKIILIKYDLYAMVPLLDRSAERCIFMKLSDVEKIYV